ncbi:TetR/AcrR family transcriptional regulator [Cytobacillus sp. FJAT-54145]|uniref:TetR/AcrR family transcriptional regulator n=1 Tax=Cytobacillus spartinae TaxID=3299023 RepID=A0ABW6KEV7_9BACI
MAPRKSSQDELSKDAILDVARELFVSEGYASISMRKIANLLKCSHGAIYYHFKNKAELFYEMIAHDFKELDQELDDVLNDKNMTNDEKLFSVMYRFIHFGLTHQNQYEVMFLLKDEEVKSYLIQEPSQSYQKFAEAIVSLSNKRLHTKEIWSLFISLHGFVTQYCRTDATFEDVKELAKSHVEFLLKAIK